MACSRPISVTRYTERGWEGGREREREREVELPTNTLMQARDTASRGEIERTKKAWKEYKIYAWGAGLWMTVISLVTVIITFARRANSP